MYRVSSFGSVDHAGYVYFIAVIGVGWVFVARKLQGTAWRSDYYFILFLWRNLLSAGCSYVKFVERSLEKLRVAAMLAIVDLPIFFFLHKLCRGEFVFSAPEQTSPYTSDSWIIAMKLKAEENSRTLTLFLLYVLENNKGTIFFEAVLQDVISRTKCGDGVTSVNCWFSVFLFVNVRN